MLSKRRLVKCFLERLDESYNRIDYLMYIGADTSDEPVFSDLKKKSSQADSPYFA
jgi:trehalose-6-phosphatase